MDSKAGVRGSPVSVEAALIALSNLEVPDMPGTERPMDEAARAAYGGEVRHQLLEVFGVPAPAGLDRLIAEAAARALSPSRCVAFIGDVFDLRPLPERRY